MPLYAVRPLFSCATPLRLTSPANSTPLRHSPDSEAPTSLHTFTRSRPSPSISPPHSPHGGRPLLPRSASSHQYLQRPKLSPRGKHTPSFADHAEEITPHPDNMTSDISNDHVDSPSRSLDATPVSPPDTSSSDDEPHAQPVHSLEQLHEAVRRIEINRQSSPTEELPSLQVDGPSHAGSNQDHRPVTPPGHLSSTARKIAHSRSSTETSILHNPITSQRDGSTDASDDEGDPTFTKPPLIRKKSGELVKPAIRPRSRRQHSSMPGTPTYSKAVHFNDDIEQVRHFLQAEKPLAVSAGTSPVETYDDEPEFPWLGPGRRGVELEMRTVNFPRDSLERQALPIRLDKLWLSADKKQLMGAVAVANLAFHKHVAARFTFDHWRTTSEVVAEYQADLNVSKASDGFDVFRFGVKLVDQGSIETKSLLLCLRYHVNGQEYWDNNDGQNFQVEFTQVHTPAPPTKKASPGLGARPIPRSRHNSPASRRPRSMPSFDDDFSSGFDGGPNFKFRGAFGSSEKAPTLPDTPPPPKVKQNVSGQQFGSRYDFGASLTAALSQAQGQMGQGDAGERAATARGDERAAPGLTRNAASLAMPATSGTDSPRHDALLANKQSLDSRAYQEFVSKFCFVGTPKAPSATSAPPAAPPPS